MNPSKLKSLLGHLRWPVGILIGALFVVSIIATVAYSGRIYPGVVVHGVAVGGKTQKEATVLITKHDAKYAAEPIAVKAGTTIIRVSPQAAGIQLDSTKAVNLAMQYGRSGNGFDRWRSLLRSVLGDPTTIGSITVDNAKLAPYTSEVANDVTVPVQNATFNINGNTVSVQAATTGKRLDMNGWVRALRWYAARGSTGELVAPASTLAPIISTAELSLLKEKVARYVSAPIMLKTPDNSKTITLSQNDIVGWLGASRSGITDMLVAPTLDTVLKINNAPIQVGLNTSRVDEYVATLAGNVDQESQNATLTTSGGKAVIAAPSKNGLKLDVAKTTEALKAVLDKPADQRNVTMVASVTKAEVREDNLEQLGLKELISQGQTFFPGSPYTRLINVRAGAAKFNGVLLKPGEVFSFGKLLGQVDASTGYVPELVIIDNHEEKQYGGGLCQVSSTAYRAALLAGLPILQRQNHSFAISYYTAPYGVPGVDATIYYPAVDMKFRNDTPGYILIQTKMVGTSLTFDYYGTKTKYGVIRGPQFVTGDADATKPSHTVFWRDVKDLNGNTIKTNEVNTYYQSSLNFPITEQFN